MRLFFFLMLVFSPLALANVARPNIVLFLVDDMGRDDPAFMGNTWHETPAMDALAAHGVVFTNAYAAAPNCKPSRASLLTGTYPTKHGVYTAVPPNANEMNQQRFIAPATRYQLPIGTPTLASLLKAEGYQTALIGKWDLGEHDTAPAAFGFDHAIGWFRGGRLVNGFFAPYDLPGLEQAEEGEYLTTRLGREAARFIASSQQPFFLMVSHYAVHVPLQAPADAVAHFRNKPRPGDGYNATYAAMLKEVDSSLADVVAALEARGERENTIIIITSDNGAMAELAMPSFLHGGKGSLSEGGIRVPLIWSGPGRVAGRVDAPVSHIDILPTVMQQLGLSINNVDGVDVSPCLQNPACSLSRSLYWHFPAYITDPRFASGHSASPAAAIRQGDWKLIDNMETGTYALFNLHDDIAEQHDLYRTRPDKARELRDALLHWQAQEQAAMPAPNPAYHTLTGWPWLRHSLQQIWQRWTTRLTVWLVLRDTE